jgi:3-oxoadipate enol-lactonase
MLIDVNGTKLNARTDGSPTAPAVLLVHSLTADLTSWDPIADALSRDYHVIRYDLPGHGRSEPPSGPCTTAMMADDAVAVLDHFGIDKAHIAGISVSGSMVQMFGINHGDRALSLTIIATGPKTPPEAWPMWDGRIAEVRSNGLGSQVEMTLERWFTPNATQAVRAKAARMIRATTAGGFTGTCEAIKAHDAFDRLEEITAKTLIISGAEDVGATPAVADRLQSRIPGSVHHAIAGAAHQVIMEQPERVTELMREHMA